MRIRRAVGLSVAPAAPGAPVRNQFRPHGGARTHPGARGRRQRRSRDGASASPTPTRSTAPRPRRRPGTCSRSTSCRRVLGTTFASAGGLAGDLAARSAVTRWPRPRSRWRRGIWTRACSGGRCARCSARPPGRSSPACRSGFTPSIDALRRSRRRGTRGRLSAHQDQDQAGLGPRAGRGHSRGASATFPLMVDANAAYTPDRRRRIWPNSMRST